MISNCWSAGADSVANSVTGIVTRKNDFGGTELATAVPLGQAPKTQSQQPSAIQPISLAPDTAAAVLQSASDAQPVAAQLAAYTQLA